MKTVGIIAEYNPFHTGHEYHISKARELTQADYVVVVMSPDFVQRGEPAVFDKFTRTRMALLGGADLVLELPIWYAAGSAEYFAEGSVALLSKTGTADYLCFGAEHPDASLFNHAAAILSDEPASYQAILKDNLRNGMSFPSARSAALSDYLSNDTEGLDLNIASFFSAPNNILGIEYCKALHSMDSSIVPVPTERIDNSYHSITPGKRFCSASAIRHSFQDKNEDSMISYIPESMQTLFSDSCKYRISPDDLLPLLFRELLSKEDYSDILDISPDLSDRIRKLHCQLPGKDWKTIVSQIKTRNITESRVRRALLHLILGLDQQRMQLFREEGVVSYARILGFRKSAGPLLHHMKKNTDIPLLTKLSDASSLLNTKGQMMLASDLYVSHIYRSILSCKYKVPFQSEYTISPVII